MEEIAPLEVLAIIGVVLGLVAIVVWGSGTFGRLQAELDAQQATLVVVAKRLGLTAAPAVTTHHPIVGETRHSPPVNGTHRQREVRLSTHVSTGATDGGAAVSLVVAIHLHDHEVQRIAGSPRGLEGGKLQRRANGLPKALRTELRHAYVQEGWLHALPMGDPRGLRGWLSPHSLVTDPDRLCRVLDLVLDFVAAAGD